MSYFAHSGEPGDKSGWQPLQDHLRETAHLATTFAEPFGLERLAFATALFHDLGKYDPRFQERLTGRGIHVDHSTAGAVILRDLAKGLDPYCRLVVELAAYAILGHHAGLPDRKTSEPSCYDARIKGFQDGRLDEVWKSEIESRLDGIVPAWLPPMVRPDNRHLAFDLSVVGRMLFSCLVDARARIETSPNARRRTRDARRPPREGADRNIFVWPGYDLRPIARDKPDTFAWGFLPENIFAAVKCGIAAHQRARRLKLTGRERSCQTGNAPPKLQLKNVCHMAHGDSVYHVVFIVAFRPLSAQSSIGAMTSFAFISNT